MMATTKTFFKPLPSSGSKSLIPSTFRSPNLHCIPHSSAKRMSTLANRASAAAVLCPSDDASHPKFPEHFRVELLFESLIYI
ncbi:unnamed protein product [Linum trigynum]|uniref:Uncharacterized protein n=1 Tax=Linum trigynum TaxID=586398 RepID=A0AAV2EUU8_9ROSI